MQLVYDVFSHCISDDDVFHSEVDAINDADFIGIGSVRTYVLW